VVIDKSGKVTAGYKGYHSGLKGALVDDIDAALGIGE
jgi:hypothetical protein